MADLVGFLLYVLLLAFIACVVAQQVWALYMLAWTAAHA